MIIKNADVFVSDGAFEKRDIFVKDDRLVANTAGEVIDATGCYAIPGLVDTHFHGCMAVDFCDGKYESIAKIAEYQLKNGIMAICPASMTFGEDRLNQIFTAAADYSNPNGADLVGINMEGPFISHAKKGAQNPKYIADPDVEMFKRLQDKANGLIKIVDIAPESDGALDFIEALKYEVAISLAHTTANYDLALKAFEAGASQLTHMYNAMNGLHHRDSGPIGAAFDSEWVRVELICDGLHISPTMVRVAFKLFGDDRIILISDSMEATGMEDGQYALGGQAVNKKGRLATLADGTIAGSVTNLYECMVNAAKNMGIPFASAVKCASVNPAKQIKIYDDYGSLDEGKYANIILVDKDSFNIKKLIFKGKLI
ncbi:MAG: N-acetylglucosamine-6-phosphate deacetylase [Christensenellaceae bacterium]|nr:N-acetylglucosamine-6-phosphate deacetylase [Christensenellaceae bacterium]